MLGLRDGKGLPTSRSSARPASTFIFSPLQFKGDSMTIQDALKSNKPFKLKGSDEVILYYEASRGPHSDVLINVSYFTIDGDLSTSLDLYASEILSNEWEVVEVVV